MTHIELRGVQKYFGAVQVIRDLNLTIADNEFIVLLDDDVTRAQAICPRQNAFGCV